MQTQSSVEADDGAGSASRPLSSSARSLGWAAGHVQAMLQEQARPSAPCHAPLPNSSAVSAKFSKEEITAQLNALTAQCSHAMAKRQALQQRVSSFCVIFSLLPAEAIAAHNRAGGLIPIRLRTLQVQNEGAFIIDALSSVVQSFSSQVRAAHSG
eukprot:6212709-Pleurochrysis_carterae.AAC.5